MPPSDVTRRQTCRRQLARLRDKDLERHDVLNVATTLMLLAATIDYSPSDDVEGHGLSITADVDQLADIQRDLNWVRTSGSVGDIEETQSKTQAAAVGLLRILSGTPAEEKGV